MKALWWHIKNVPYHLEGLICDLGALRWWLPAMLRIHWKRLLGFSILALFFFVAFPLPVLAAMVIVVGAVWALYWCFDSSR